MYHVHKHQLTRYISIYLLTKQADADIDEELEELKRHVRQMEEDALLAGITVDPNPTTTSKDNEKQNVIDSRSVYVGQVEYSASTDELSSLFSSCGTIQRVTIITDKYTGNSKGYAYIEFTDSNSVDNAILLNDTEFKGRTIKVTPKRTNIPRHELSNDQRSTSSSRGYRGSRGGGYRGTRGGYRGRGGYHRGRGGRGQPY